MIAFTALADPTRFRIVELLALSGRLPVGEISKQFAVSPPSISQHLKVLKQANLVQVETKGQQRIYSLNAKGILEIGQWVSKLRGQWEQRFHSLDALLEEEMDS